MLRLVLIKNWECANSYHENPPNRISNRFFYNSTLWKMRCSLNPKAQVVNKAQRQLRPELYFLIFFLNRGLWKYSENPDLCFPNTVLYKIMFFRQNIWNHLLHLASQRNYHFVIIIIQYVIKSVAEVFFYWCVAEYITVGNITVALLINLGSYPT